MSQHSHHASSGSQLKLTKGGGPSFYGGRENSNTLNIEPGAKEEHKQGAARTLAAKRNAHIQHRVSNISIGQLPASNLGMTTRAFGKDLSNIQQNVMQQPPKILRVKSSIGSSNNMSSQAPQVPSSASSRGASMMSGVTSGNHSQSRRGSIHAQPQAQNVENIALNNIHQHIKQGTQKIP